MSLWLVLILVALWIGICAIVIAACVMAARSDRADEAFRRAPDLGTDAEQQTRRRPALLDAERRRRMREAAEAQRDVEQDASG